MKALLIVFLVFYFIGLVFDLLFHDEGGLGSMLIVILLIFMLSKG